MNEGGEEGYWLEAYASNSRVAFISDGSTSNCVGYTAYYVLCDVYFTELYYLLYYFIFAAEVFLSVDSFFILATIKL